MTKADLWFELFDANRPKAVKSQPKLALTGVEISIFKSGLKHQKGLQIDNMIYDQDEALALSNFIREYFTDLGE